MGLIKAVGHVAIRVPDLDASVDWATTIMGLREVERVDGTSYLTCGVEHHSLMYIGDHETAIDHISLEAESVEALDRLSETLRAEGVEVLSDRPQERAIAHAIRFPCPTGAVVEVFVGMEQGQPGYRPAGIRPRKFGHPMLKCGDDTGPAQAFFERVLGFRLSDIVGPGMLVFLRCNPDHHGVGLQLGGDGLHHYAWEVESLGVLGQLGDLLGDNGGRFIWGPGRHGAGGNIYTYHPDPAGVMVEYYADLIRINDEATYEPGRWSLDDGRFANLWGPGPPLPELNDYGAPLR